MICKLQLLYFQKFVDSGTQTEECAGCKKSVNKKQKIEEQFKVSKVQIVKRKIGTND